MNITVKIKDAFIINDDLFSAILESIKKSADSNLDEKLHYESHIDDSRVIVFTSGEQELKIVRYGENNNDTKIKGPKPLVKEFIQLMAVHGAMLVVNEICRSAFNEDQHGMFIKTLKDQLTSGIEESFESCRKVEIGKKIE